MCAGLSAWRGMDSGRAGSYQSSRPADLIRSSRRTLSLCVPVSAAFAHALMSLQRPLIQLSQLALQLRPSALAWRPVPSLSRSAPRSRRIHLSPSLASRPSEAPTTTSNCAVPAISNIPLEPASLPPPPSSPITRYVCVVEYVGTNYHGWSPSAERDRACSVAGALESCIAPLARDRSVKVVGSGRTDRGVHALGQVFHVDLDRGLNRLGDGHAEVISPHRVSRLLLLQLQAGAITLQEREGSFWFLSSPSALSINALLSVSTRCESPSDDPGPRLHPRGAHRDRAGVAAPFIPRATCRHLPGIPLQAVRLRPPHPLLHLREGPMLARATQTGFRRDGGECKNEILGA